MSIFTANTTVRKMFLLYGIGGIGKTRIYMPTHSGLMQLLRIPLFKELLHLHSLPLKYLIGFLALNLNGLSSLTMLMAVLNWWKSFFLLE
ncbi:hypothetical protein BDQ17DRAFT_1378506 [Cyathus striatus]|nr:hypothetical protein BDQ17DRAFT_1378506 [Cyathus striatus]